MYTMFPNKLKAIGNRELPMSGPRTPAEVALEIQGTRTSSASLRSTVLLSQTPMARQITEPRVDGGAAESNCPSSVQEGLSETVPPGCVARGDRNSDPEDSSSPGASGAEWRPKASMAQNLPCRKITDLGRGGDDANEAVSDSAMPSRNRGRMPVQEQDAMPGVDASGLSVNVKTGADAASLMIPRLQGRSTRCLVNAGAMELFTRRRFKLVRSIENGFC